MKCIINSITSCTFAIALTNPTLDYISKSATSVAQFRKKLIDVKKVRLYELNVKVRDEFFMTHNYGVNWKFEIILTDIREVKEGGILMDFPKIINKTCFEIIEYSHF